MKAEHRKQLETNTLADRMGRLLTKVKTRPQRGTILWVILIAVLALALGLFLWAQSGAKSEASKRWLELEAGDRDILVRLQRQYGDTNAGKAAAFQLAWFMLWDNGIKGLMIDAGRALENIQEAQNLYRKLAKECADDPILGPEAMYAIAVAEETLALHPKDQDRRLDSAAELFAEVEKKYPESALGKEAGQRAKQLRNEQERAKIATFYLEMSHRPEVFFRLVPLLKPKKDSLP